MEAYEKDLLILLISEGIISGKIAKLDNLQTARVRAWINISLLITVLKTMIDPTPLIKNMMPPILALFSTFVESLKYPIQLGMPNPKETPKRKAIVNTIGRSTMVGDNKVSEEKTPSKLQKKRKAVLLPILFDNIAPPRAESAVPQKFKLQTRKLSKWFKPISAMMPSRTFIEQKYQINALVINQMLINVTLNSDLSI